MLNGNVLPTNKAKRVAKRAEEVARGWNHTLVDPEHLLYALVTEDGGLANTILMEWGVNPKLIGTRIEVSIKRGRLPIDPHASVEFTERTTDTLVSAEDKAAEQGFEFANTGHLLLAILFTVNGLAYTALHNSGVTGAYYGTSRTNCPREAPGVRSRSES